MQILSMCSMQLIGTSHIDSLLKRNRVYRVALDRKKLIRNCLIQNNKRVIQKRLICIDVMNSLRQPGNQLPIPGRKQFVPVSPPCNHGRKIAVRPAACNCKQRGNTATVTLHGSFPAKQIPGNQPRITHPKKRTPARRSEPDRRPVHPLYLIKSTSFFRIWIIRL